MARLSQARGDSGHTASHSFIRRPCPGSNRTPSPVSTRASTRDRGSLTMNSPRLERLANIRPLIFSEPEPNQVCYAGSSNSRNVAILQHLIRRGRVYLSNATLASQVRAPRLHCEPSNDRRRHRRHRRGRAGSRPADCLSRLCEDSASHSSLRPSRVRDSSRSRHQVPGVGSDAPETPAILPFRTP